MEKYFKGALARGRRILAKEAMLEEEQPFLSYSQSGEDLIIDFVLKNNLGINDPTYLDIGANHPISLSNTYRFYLKGSRGVLVEPDPDLAAILRLKRPGDTVLDVGVGTSKQELDFYRIMPPSLNTFSKRSYGEYKSSFPYAKLVDVIKVKTLPINDIFKKHFPKGLDILSVDIEGLDYEILSSLNIKKYRPKVICIESIEFDNGYQVKSKKVANYLYKNGYFLYADTCINSIFVDEKYWTKTKQPKLKNFIGR